MAKITFEVEAPFEAPQNPLELAAMLIQVVRQLPGYSHSTDEHCTACNESEAELPGVAFQYGDGSLKGFYVRVDLAFEGPEGCAECERSYGPHYTGECGH